MLNSLMQPACCCLLLPATACLLLPATACLLLPVCCCLLLPVYCCLPAPCHMIRAGRRGRGTFMPTCHNYHALLLPLQSCLATATAVSLATATAGMPCYCHCWHALLLPACPAARPAWCTGMVHGAQAWPLDPCFCLLVAALLLPACMPPAGCGGTAA